MPHFTLRFIGMSLFVRYPEDKKVDVRFVTKAMPSMAGMKSSALDQHIPILVMSPDSWDYTSNDDNFPGRAPGRPIYLARYDSVVIWRNGEMLPGPVSVSTGTPVLAKSGLPAVWNNFDEFIPKLGELFPNSSYAPAEADVVAPFGVITLTGGSLGTEPPSIAQGEGPWEVVDRKTGDVLNASRFISDVAVYSFDFERGDQVLLNLTDGVETTQLFFRSDADINGWVAHEPFLASLSRAKMLVGKEVTARHVIRHLHVAGAFVKPKPNLKLFPPIFQLPSKAGRVSLHPDDNSCPPTQVVLGPEYRERSRKGRRA